jgi:DNA-binding FadR family transcriptional regulator
MQNPKALFSPIREKRTFERVSAKIKSLILDGVLKLGDHLPSEIELARQFEVSRQTIREALRILELTGFITVQKGGSGGPLIQDTLINSISNLYLDAFQMEKITIEELTVVRCDIEKAMLNHVIDKAVESDFAALEANLTEANRKIQDNQPAIHENIEFHNLLAKASKNHVYSVVVGSITAATRDLLTRLIDEPQSESSPSEYDERMVNTRVAVTSHEAILEAIRKRDKKGAARLLEQHLHEVGNRLNKLIQ